MKTDIHPKYYLDAKVVCSCGNSFTVGATQPEIKVDICSKCHPFYTGENKLIDTAGRVEKFKTRSAKASAAPKKKTKVRVKKAKSE
jgi:large subunit ribosomal protein L31